MLPRDPTSTDGPRRLLLVDDHDDMTELLRMLLARRGFDVTVAATVAGALAAAERGAIDILVSDLDLPDGSGCDLLVKLRESRSLPAIALSGFARVADVERCIDAGFDEHLAKPATIEGLVAAIERVCRAHASR